MPYYLKWGLAYIDSNGGRLVMDKSEALKSEYMPSPYAVKLSPDSCIRARAVIKFGDLHIEWVEEE